MLMALYYKYFLTHVTHMRKMRNDATSLDESRFVLGANVNKLLCALRA